MGYRLAPYDPSLAPVIAGWPRDAGELDAWASLGQDDAAPAAFARWHADPDVHPFVLRDGDRACAYGEVWVDAGEGEAELARIIVDPALRGRGAGRALTRLLVDRARELGFAEVWLRVRTDNGAAIACYTAAGFRRTRPELERAFNAGQPHEYRWMRFEGG